ncbi:gfo/Idh/MocA family oxidoreductase, partial [Methylobacterium sp. WL19]
MSDASHTTPSRRLFMAGSLAGIGGVLASERAAAQAIPATPT